MESEKSDVKSDAKDDIKEAVKDEPKKEVKCDKKDDKKGDSKKNPRPSFLLKQKWKLLSTSVLVVVVSVLTHHFIYQPNVYENLDQSKQIHPNDDEEFLQLISDTYPDDELVEWQPATPIQGDPNELGYMGKGVVVPPERKDEATQRFKENEFNVVASEMLPLNRTLADNRFPECLEYEYPKKLPTTSLIIVFHNEAWSTLLRTMWSVYNTAPKALLKEIILVDDSSDREHLKTKLDEYVQTFPVRVIIKRTQERTGLIQARLLGAKSAMGQVLTFLDAHCECNAGWLEALLARVAQNRKVAVAPMIDVIADDDFRLETAIVNEYGAFELDFTFTWIPLSEREITRLHGDRSEPIRSPAMAGGLFSIDKEYFYKIGSYDEGMKIWGGENIEMSLRLWMCGGMIEQQTCSRVGHVFRKNSPYTLPGGADHVVHHNTARFVDVWVDEHKIKYYASSPNALKERTDVSKRIELRKKLKCKSFDWYLRNIYPESTYNVKARHIGSIESVAEPDMCLDTFGHKKQNDTITIGDCHDSGGFQFFIVGENGEIRVDHMCIDASELFGRIRLFKCHGEGGNQKWVYDEEAKTFVQNGHNCLTLQEDSDPTLEECDGSEAQQWILRPLQMNVD